jgi:hypothetical protein
VDLRWPWGRGSASGPFGEQQDVERQDGKEGQEHRG